MRAALERLADAQEATQAELQDLAAQMRQLTQRVDKIAAAQTQLFEAQTRTEASLQQLVQIVGVHTHQIDKLLGRDLERYYRDHAPSFFQPLLRRISVPSASDVEMLADEAERRNAITTDEHRDMGLADVIVHGISRADGHECYLVAEVSLSVNDLDVVRAQRRAAILTRITGLPVIAAVSGERIRPDADSSARAAGLWRVLDGVTLGPTDGVAPERLTGDELKSPD